MTDNINEKGFLSRWSEQKQKTKEKQSETPVTNDHKLNEFDQENANAKLDAERLANKQQAEAIDIETLTDESDYKVFFKEGVPEQLKQLALRKLWRSNPVFANLDGLNDYDENFAASNMVLETFESAWKVGEGYFNKEEETKKNADKLAVIEVEEIEKNRFEGDEKETPYIDVNQETESELIEETQVTLPRNKNMDDTENHQTQPKKPKHLSLRNRLEID